MPTSREIKGWNEITMGYSEHTLRSIKSLKELKPGDHIQVPSSNTGESILSAFNVGSISRSAFSSYLENSNAATNSGLCCGLCYCSRSSPSTSGSRPTPEKCDGTVIAHHLLVIKVINENKIRVVHKTTPEGIVEEEKCYLPKDITVLEYESPYTGKVAITRAREFLKKGEKYDLISSNCEHFVTEARTGVKQSSQVQRGAAGGAAGVGLGATVGGTTGAVVNPRRACAARVTVVVVCVCVC